MTLSTAAAFSGVLLFPILMCLAALSDLTAMRIANGLIAVLLAAYAVLAPLAGFGISAIGLAAAVAMVIFVAGFAFFAMGWLGGGDVKLATATVLWLGADQALAYVVYTTLLGGALALSFLVFRRLPLPAPLQRRDWIDRLHSGRNGVPYGVAMAGAALLFFPKTAWMAGLTT